MRDLNIEFQEKYKSVDNFIKDAQGTSEGVSGYIALMESAVTEGTLFRSIAEWGNDYKHLKRMRWIRNQLAHEVSIDSDICQEDDYDWLCDFYDRLYDGDDSIARYNRELARQNKRQRAKPVEPVESYDRRSYPERKEYYTPLPEEPKRNGSTWLIFILIAVLIAIIIKIITLLIA